MPRHGEYCPLRNAWWSDLAGDWSPLNGLGQAANLGLQNSSLARQALSSNPYANQMGAANHSTQNDIRRIEAAIAAHQQAAEPDHNPVLLLLGSG